MIDKLKTASDDLINREFRSSKLRFCWLCNAKESYDCKDCYYGSDFHVDKNSYERLIAVLEAICSKSE